MIELESKVESWKQRVNQIVNFDLPIRKGYKEDKNKDDFEL